MHVSREDIEKISYLNIKIFDDRVIPLQPCYLGDSNWEFWTPTEKGLFPLKVMGVADGCYFAKQEKDKNDIHLELIDLIMKRAYYKDLVHFEKGIVEDINNLSASAEKINLFHDLWKKDNNLISYRFVTTELEYIFKVCRSLFSNSQFTPKH